ncbi:ABC transporter ATP-binding protein [Amycolatopsis jejuensis]|uniref:ABC transporter ATP-binding protein n=1 Tax=Amycolatopsis jejuensis TaxID=330084 RepID=UPI00068A8DAF|nr:ABC transporter ATP-binding protein [Amycolatopsis jejuensis]
MTTSGASVELAGVTKRFGTAPPAVDALDLHVQPGEFLTLLGPSGSGKTTTLNMVAGFAEPTVGEIRLDGAPITRLPPHRRGIGMVFQHYALFPHLSVADNIAYPLRRRKMPKADVAREVGEALERVELTQYATRLPRELSGGQQQRVAVARATVFRPRLLLMDEPLGALDKKLRETLQLGFKQLHRDLGITMLYVTHDQEEALVMSDRIAVFHGGRIEQLGSATDLYERPSSRFVASFLGQSNLADGTARHQGGGTTVSTSAAVLCGRTSDVSDGSAATLVVRPERTRLVPAGRPRGANVLSGRVRDVVYLGASSKLVVDLDAGVTWSVALAAGTADVPAAGSTVDLTFDEQDALVVPPHSHLGVARAFAA